PTPPSPYYTLALHDVLPISIKSGERYSVGRPLLRSAQGCGSSAAIRRTQALACSTDTPQLWAITRYFAFATSSRCSYKIRSIRGDRKSTRLNSSHVSISYAV